MLPSFWRQLGFSFYFIFIGCVQVAFLKVTVKNLDLVKILMNALKCETFHRLHVHTCWVYHILMLASYINIVRIYYCHCQKKIVLLQNLLGVPRRQPHRHSGLATLPSLGAVALSPLIIVD